MIHFRYQVVRHPSKPEGFAVERGRVGVGKGFAFACIGESQRPQVFRTFADAYGYILISIRADRAAATRLQEELRVHVPCATCEAKGHGVIMAAFCYACNGDGEVQR